LKNNCLTNLPSVISNLGNLKELKLQNNKLNILPIELLKIKLKLKIDETSYEMDNLNIDSRILIFSSLITQITNLPINLKQIWLSKNIKEYNIKIPFDCEIMFY